MANHPFYKRKIWQSLRKRKLLEQPLCERCKMNNRLIEATTVHHIIAHKGNYELFKNYDNLQSVCKRCHDVVEQSIERRGYDVGVDVDGWPKDERHPFNGGQPVGDLQFSIPANVRPCDCRINLVYGPPCAGKSFLVSERAEPDDIIIDLDRILEHLDYRPWSDNRVHYVKALRHRDDIIRRLCEEPADRIVWLIVCAPKLEEREAWQKTLGNVHFIRIGATRRLCRARVMSRPAYCRDVLLKAIDDWFLTYTC